MDEGWGLLSAAIADATEPDSRRRPRGAIGCSGRRRRLVEYDRAETVLREGIADAERVQLWNDRHYMAAHLGHVLWATGRWDDAEDLARHALADGRGGITTRITALHVLGYVALGRGDLDTARGHLDEALKLGERMRELQRLSPALWGLAEVALAADDPATAADRCDRGATASAAVADAAYLFPFAVTGTRALLAMGETELARRWVERVAKPIEARAIPGTLAAIDHARGLVALTDGSTGVGSDRPDRGRRGLDGPRAGLGGRLGPPGPRPLPGPRQPAERGASLGRHRASPGGAPRRTRRDRRRGCHPRIRQGTGERRAVGAADRPRVRRRPAGRPRPHESQDRRGPRRSAARPSRRTSSTSSPSSVWTAGSEIAAWTAARPVLHSGPHGDDREE